MQCCFQVQKNVIIARMKMTSCRADAHDCQQGIWGQWGWGLWWVVSQGNSQGKGSSIIPILNGWNFPSQWKDSLPRDLLITQSFNHSELRVLFCFLNEEMLGYLTAGISVGTLCVLPEISVAFWVLWAQVHDSTTNEERLILSWE